MTIEELEKKYDALAKDHLSLRERHDALVALVVGQFEAIRGKVFKDDEGQGVAQGIDAMKLIYAKPPAKGPEKPVTSFTDIYKGGRR